MVIRQGPSRGRVSVPLGAIRRQDLSGRVANDLCIYRAVGFAVYATGSKRVTDEMFTEAARATGDQMNAEQLRVCCLPAQSNVLETDVRAAIRVATPVFYRNLARVDRLKDVESWMRASIYRPQYGSWAVLKMACGSLRWKAHETLEAGLPR